MARFRLHHAPNTRASGTLWLLEEAGADYALIRHELAAGTQKQPAFLALNPQGKLPVLEDAGPAGDWRGIVVTEAGAIAAYLADALPEVGLAPEVGTPARALYATAMLYANGVMEPALMDKVSPRAEAPDARMVGWPSFDETVARVDRWLQAGPWLLGNRFSAADVVLGGGLAWYVGWKVLEPTPAIARYVHALNARPARIRARALETDAAAEGGKR